MKIRIGSRGSDLALWQAHFVEDQLQKLGHEVEIIIISTKGDRIQDLSFDKIEGKGFFTKEIEEALLNNEIDLAVHSHKDLETTNPDGLIIGAVSYREDPTDLLLICKEAYDSSETFGLKNGANVGTSSARRKTQLIRLREDLIINDLRGNVPTRINKLREGKYDAIVLASAGLKRLKLDTSDLELVTLNPHAFVPAPAQGVLGLQIREVDQELKAVLDALNHKDVAESIEIERSVLRLLEGGCQLPLGVYAEKKSNSWTVHVSFAINKDEASIITKYEADDSEGLAELIVNELKSEA